MATVYIIGHKNPDTDSIASACAYANLKQVTDPNNTYIPARCGNANNQTRYIFQRNELQLPMILKDVNTKVEDIMTTDLAYVYENEPVFKVFHLVNERNFRVLPVVDKNSSLKGIVGAAELLKLFMQEDFDQRPRCIINPENIAEVIKGKVLHTGPVGDMVVAIMVGAMAVETSQEHIDRAGADETILVVGNRPDVIMQAIARELPAIIITGAKKEDIVVDFSSYKGWVYLSSLDSAETVRRVVLASPASSILRKEVDSISSKDYLETAKEILLGHELRAVPVVDNGKLVGIITRSNLLLKHKTKLILMDHNEADQAVDGVETAEILEIIDHHRLGAVKTSSPVTFYAKPVGSTCTLVYQLYKTAGVVPSKESAMLMMGGILSDTVMLKSPTATNDDVVALSELEKVAGVSYKEYGLDIFSATDNLSSRTPESIVMTDFKKYVEKGVAFGVGQIEVVTLADLDEMKDRLIAELERQKNMNGLKWSLLLITDIIREESVLLSSDFASGEQLLSYKKISDHCFSLPGVLSRKKQLLPEILQTVEELS